MLPPRAFRIPPLSRALLAAGLGFVAGLAAPNGLAAECHAASGSRTNALVELYTSEGCSSCPPAERWLSSLAGAARDARVVPLAFHVQYWDSQGWKDRFGDPRYTQRQEAEAKLAGARFVYTPQVVVGGRDLPRWHSGSDFDEAVEAISHRRVRAKLEVASHAEGGGVAGRVDVSLTPGLPPTHLALVVAAVQDGLASRVTAGENRGERLAHDFVARDLATFPLTAGVSTHAFAFLPRVEWDPKRVSITAFLQDTSTGEVVQAVAAPPCP